MGHSGGHRALPVHRSTDPTGPRLSPAVPEGSARGDRHLAALPHLGEARSDPSCSWARCSTFRPAARMSQGRKPRSIHSLRPTWLPAPTAAANALRELTPSHTLCPGKHATSGLPPAAGEGGSGVGGGRGHSRPSGRGGPLSARSCPSTPRFRTGSSGGGARGEGRQFRAARCPDGSCAGSPLPRPPSHPEGVTEAASRLLR